MGGSINNYAIVFPGQGSQALGMLSEWATLPAFAEVFKIAKDVLGYDLWELIQSGPVERLNQTIFTQPALLASSVACWRSLSATQDIMPRYLAGHSLGEYSALVCAGVLSLEDGLKVVAKRGQLMQEAVPEGAGAMMAILGLEFSKVQEACSLVMQGLEEGSLDTVSCANFNSPEQVVIAGTRAEVLAAGEAAKLLGAKRALLLPMSVPSHCALMAPAARKLAVFLESIPFAAPKIPVIHNVMAAPLESGAASAMEIRRLLIAQLCSPVQWSQTIEFLAQQDITQIYECGPGKVLSALVKRIVPGLVAEPLSIDTILAG